MKFEKFVTVAVLLTGVALASPAEAQNYDLKIYNTSVGAKPVDQKNPSYPSGLRRGQEGWVSVNYVITADGMAADPVIVDSVGGGLFEESVREAVVDWRFEPPGERLANNTTNVRFEIHLGRDMATSNFLRRYRRILTHLHREENAKARESVDQTYEMGGWNLYESTMLWLMIGRVEGAEGNDAGKLEAYRRALGASNENSIDSENLRELLAKVFRLEMELSQFAAARTTLRALKREPGSQKDITALADLEARLEQALAGDEPIAAKAVLFNPCDSDVGQPLWTYAPARRTFSFAALNGNVERFEVRCERERLEGLVEADKTWSLPVSAKNCEVFVFGDDGASFEFVEHLETEPVGATGLTAVAKSDVLD
jgi:TonB family protein